MLNAKLGIPSVRSHGYRKERTIDCSCWLVGSGGKEVSHTSLFAANRAFMTLSGQVSWHK